jgi:diacylglycerol kinase (ATP)
VRPDDGIMDVCIIRARSLWDFLQVAWSVVTGQPGGTSHLSFLTGQQSVLIDAEGPLPVQGDGDLVAHTPVEVHIVPQAVRLIVPPGA